MKKILTNTVFIITVLLFIIVSNVSYTTYQNRNEIFAKYNQKIWEGKFNNSQWRVKHAKYIISDQDLYAYYGYLLTQGHDPSLGNAEVPPLGKYLIGYSERLTSFVGIYGILSSILLLYLYYVFNKLIFKSTLISLIPVAILSFDPVFKGQIGTNLLDLLYCSLLFGIFISLLKKNYILSAICAGLFMGVKSPFVVILVYVTIFILLVFNKKYQSKYIICMPFITVGIYVLCYAQLFLLGHSFIYFLKVQKFMIHFYQVGAKGVIGAVFPLLLTGYWITWFGKNSFIKEWFTLWPLAFFTSLYYAHQQIKNKKEISLFDSVMIIWLVVYFIFLSLTPVFSRYLLLALPFIYTLMVEKILLFFPQLSKKNT